MSSRKVKSQQVIHGSLKGGRSVCKPKRHYPKFIVTVNGAEGGFGDVLRRDTNLVVPSTEHLGHDVQRRVKINVGFFHMHVSNVALGAKGRCHDEGLIGSFSVERIEQGNEQQDPPMWRWILLEDVQANDVGLKRHHIVPYEELNGVSIALVASVGSDNGFGVREKRYVVVMGMWGWQAMGWFE
nr:hypothetical protein [Tanacetum cinerariifolium]